MCFTNVVYFVPNDNDQGKSAQQAGTCHGEIPEMQQMNIQNLYFWYLP